MKALLFILLSINLMYSQVGIQSHMDTLSYQEELKIVRLMDSVYSTNRDSAIKYIDLNDSETASIWCRELLFWAILSEDTLKISDAVNLNISIID